MSTIFVENIAKSFGAVKAVEDVSFEVNPGEIFGLLGPMALVKRPPSGLFLTFLNRMQEKLAFSAVQ
jgi:ABC-2 type transport system ATP-binding protein